MNVFCEQRDNITVVTIESTVSEPESTKFKQFLLKRIENGSYEFLLDFTKVSYIDSSGASVLLTLLQAARRKGGDIRLACLNERVKETIRQIGLHHVFRQYSSIDEGINSFQPVEYM